MIYVVSNVAAHKAKSKFNSKGLPVQAETLLANSLIRSLALMMMWIECLLCSTDSHAALNQVQGCINMLQGANNSYLKMNSILDDYRACPSLTINFCAIKISQNPLTLSLESWKVNVNKGYLITFRFQRI